jgi:hypothetical protein
VPHQQQGGGGKEDELSSPKLAAAARSPGPSHRRGGAAHRHVRETGEEPPGGSSGPSLPAAPSPSVTRLDDAVHRRRWIRRCQLGMEKEVATRRATTSVHPSADDKEPLHGCTSTSPRRRTRSRGGRRTRSRGGEARGAPRPRRRIAVGAGEAPRRGDGWLPRHALLNAVTIPPEIIPYYRLNHSIWSLSDNKEVSR